MIKNNKKKKGFTLIELVIVLAVLAIIALIAIPNFTRVRNNALVQADNTSCEQITNITQTAIAEGVLAPVSGSKYTISITFNGKSPQVDSTKAPPYNANYTGGTTAATTAFADHIRDIDAPQVAGKDKYDISIDEKGYVSTVTGKK